MRVPVVAELALEPVKEGRLPSQSLLELLELGLRKLGDSPVAAGVVFSSSLESEGGDEAVDSAEGVARALRRGQRRGGRKAGGGHESDALVVGVEQLRVGSVEVGGGELLNSARQRTPGAERRSRGGKNGSPHRAIHLKATSWIALMLR